MYGVLYAMMHYIICPPPSKILDLPMMFWVLVLGDFGDSFS